MLNSKEVVVRAKAGDEEAFRAIFNRYSRPIVGFLIDLVGNADFAHELAQETFVRAYKNLRVLREETRLSTWLFGIARNVAREHVRARVRAEDHIDVDQSGVLEMRDERQQPERDLLDRELNGKIRSALSHLDDDKRVVFSLQAFHQCSYEEIVEITGFSLAKVKSDLHRAKSEMRRRLKPYLEVRHEMR